MRLKVKRLNSSGDFESESLDHVGRCRFPAAVLLTAVIPFVTHTPAFGIDDPSASPNTMKVAVVKTSETADQVLVDNFAKHLRLADYDVQVHPGVEERPEIVNEGADFIVAGSFRNTDAGFDLTVYSQLPPPATIRPATIDVSEASEQGVRHATIRVRRFLESNGVQIVIIKSKYDAAVETLKNEPDHFESLVVIGLHRYYHEDWHGAIAVLKEAAKVAPPGNPTAHYAIARCYSEMGDPEETRRYLNETLAVDNSHEGARLELGNLYLEQSDYDRAIDQYNQLIALDKKNIERATWNLGLAFMKKERLDEAQEQFRTLSSSETFAAAAKRMVRRIEEEKERAETRAAKRQQRADDELAWQQTIKRRILVAMVALFAVVLAGLIGVHWWRMKKIATGSVEHQMKVAGYVMGGLFALLGGVVGTGLGAMLSQAFQ